MIAIIRQGAGFRIALHNGPIAALNINFCHSIFLLRAGYQVR
jgi:hypothetical protein